MNMETITVKEQDIEREREAVVGDISSLQSPSKAGSALGLPGIEIILKWIAEKIVLHMLLAFVNRKVYEKYQANQTATGLAEAHSDIITLGLSSRPAVDPVTVRTDLVTMITAEGLPQSQAEAIVEKMTQRLNRSFGLQL
jgi:hypothetical protein